MKTVIEDLLSVLFDPSDIIEIRFLPSRKQRWFASYFEVVEAWDAIDKANRFGENVYFGANPRKACGGSASDVACFRCLFVDIDLEVSVDSVLRRVEELGLPEPTAMVRSGHGVHCYWRLASPAPDAPAWTAMQKRLIAALDGDRAIHDPPRIMRLPGTWNTKREPKVRCELVSSSPSRTEWAVFDSVLPQAAQQTFADRVESSELSGERRPLARATLEFLAVGAPVGERNSRLFRAASDMAGCGWPEGEARKKLTDAAHSCCLDPEETQRTIDSAFGKPRTPAKPLDIPDGEVGYVPGVEAQPRRNPGANADATPARDFPALSGPRPELSGEDEPGYLQYGSDWINPAPTPKPALANSVQMRGRTDDEKPWLLHVGCERIAKDLSEFTGGWPRVAGGAMFAPGRETPDGELPTPGAILRLPSRPSAVFAWIQKTADLNWTDKQVFSLTRDMRTAVTKAEFAEYIAANPSTVYDAAEILPHEPPVPGVWYAPAKLPDDNGESLAELVAAMNPETEDDRLLILAGILQPGWGGPCGARPALVFTADGTESGKSVTAVDVIGGLWGVIANLEDENDERSVIEQIGEGLRTGGRCVIHDNAKKKIDGQFIEWLITTPVLKGRVMYVGPVRAPNRLTLILTVNGPVLSADFASRAVTIKMGRPKPDTGFRSWVQGFVRDRRPQLVAAAMKILRAQPVPIERGSLGRWGGWQVEVLGRAMAAARGSVEGMEALRDAFPDGVSTGEEVAAMLQSRRNEANDDAEKGEDIEGAFSHAMAQIHEKTTGIRMDLDRVFLTGRAMAVMLRMSGMCLGMSPAAVCSWVHRLKGVRAIGSIAPQAGRFGKERIRGRWWTPGRVYEEAAGPGGMVRNWIVDYPVYDDRAVRADGFTVELSTVTIHDDLPI